MSNDTVWEKLAVTEMECDELRAENRRLQTQVQIAAGMLSTTPGFSDKHPQVALEAIQVAALRGEEKV
jgi:hypothetical protein